MRRQPTGREQPMEEVGGGGGERTWKGGRRSRAETDKTQASPLPGAEALENKFGNIIPQDLH